MKKIALLTYILLQVSFSWSQSFHFVNDSTALIKDTDQSPAHWYIEVYNDAGVDTVLRWKAFFQNIPAAWQIDLDDQTNYTLDKASKVKESSSMVANFIDFFGFEGSIGFKKTKMVIAVGNEEIERLKERYNEFIGLFPYLELWNEEILKDIEPILLKDRKKLLISL